MKKRLFLVIVALAFLSTSTSTSADILVEWEGLAGTFQESSYDGPGISGINLTRGSGLNEAAGANFNSNNFSVNGDLQDAFNNNDYLSFGFTLADGNSVDLENILAELDRSATGPPLVYLFSDVTGFSLLNVIQTSQVSDAGSVIEFDLSGNASFQDLTTPVEFRFYFSGATASAGTADIEDDDIVGTTASVGLQINGTSAIPEPGSWTLIAIVALGSLAAGRRRRYKTQSG